MPTTLRKDALKAGNYRKGDEKIVVPEALVQRLNDNTKLLESRGYRNAFWMEHPGKGDRKGAPMKIGTQLAADAERDPFFAGWVKQHVLGDDGMVRVEVEPQSDDQAGKLIESGGFVSPQFGPFKDEEGNEYDHVFMHHALTRKPVNRGQSRTFEPVQPKTIRNAAEIAEPVQFSLDDFEPDEDDADDPTIVQLSDDDAAGGGESKPKPKADGECSEACKATIEALAAFKVTVDPSSPIAKHREGLAELLSTVSRMAAHQERENEAMAKDTESKAGNGTASVAESPVVVTMSEGEAAAKGGAAAAVAHTDPKDVVQMSEFTALKSRNSKLEALATNGQRKEYGRRIEAALSSGRCTPDRAKAMTDLANTHQFSDSDDKSELDIRLEVIEELPAGAVWTDEEKVVKFSALEAPRSPFFTGADDDEPTDEDIDEHAKTVTG